MAADQPAVPPLSVVAFGTSLTARGGWTDALRLKLVACLHRQVTITVVAEPGVTSDWAVAHMPSVTRSKPDVILVEFAANDASLTKWISLDRSRANLESVFSYFARELPQSRRLYLGMNPVHSLRGWLRPRLAGYVEEHARLALKYGGEFVDLRRHWEALGSKRLAIAIPDGLHPLPSAAVDIVPSVLAETIARGRCSR